MKTIKIKKVLIALDYNPSAQKVAEMGFSIAESLNAEIVLLHVVSDPSYYLSTGYSPIMGFTGFSEIDPLQLQYSIEVVKKSSQEFLDKTKHHLGDKQIQCLVKEGDCADCILQTVKDLHVDIIVMGSHSRKWLENLLMGSVTEKVLHHTSKPLFIIPTKQNKVA